MPVRKESSGGSRASSISDRDDSLDISWLKDESEENGEALLDASVYARQAVVELEGAIEDLQAVLMELGEDVEEAMA